MVENRILNRSILVGTRESKLARLQTDIVIALLAKAQPDLEFEVVPITTGGDKILNKPIAEIGTRGVFVKELEEALFEGTVDFVVHSLKDLPTELPEGLVLASVMDRSDPRDVLVSKNNTTLLKLPAGSRVATSSRRRTAQLRAIRHDLEFIDIRGNIPTRLRKHDEGHCDAMVLAAAGLLRLELHDRISEYFEPLTCTPAVGQGALAIECRQDDSAVIALLKTIESADVRSQITAERAFLDKLGGGCAVPIGAICQSLAEGWLQMTGCVAALDGSKVIRAVRKTKVENAFALGVDLADELGRLGAEEILTALREQPPAAISPP